MKAESDPITPDEFFIRRIHKSKLRHTAGKPDHVSPNAFEPLMPGPKIQFPDEDGISLFREACLEDPEQVLSTMSQDRLRANGLVRVPASFLLSLGLNVRPSKIDEIPGHVVIPELSCGEYSSNESKCKKLMEEIAKEASKSSNLIRIPPDLLNTSPS